jgi:hypothetical protein
VSQPIRIFVPSAKARRSISCTTRQPDEADRLDLRRLVDGAGAGQHFAIKFRSGVNEFRMRAIHGRAYRSVSVPDKASR